jgi:cytochrome c oxidase assembly protein subunit 15
MPIFVYMLWMGLTLYSGTARVAPLAAPLRPLARATTVVVAWIALTMLAGGFTAGLDAGFTYNTFPLMDGHWIPVGSFADWRAPFEDVATVQFDHRILAMTAVVLVLALWVYARRNLRAGRELGIYHALAGVVVLQASLGISTLLLVVPTPLAAAHQAVAFVLLGLAVWARHGLHARILSA